MSGKEPKIKLQSFKFSKDKMKSDQVPDIQQKTDEENSNSSGISKIKMRTKRNVINKLDDGRANYTSDEIDEATRIINDINYEDLCELYSSFKKNDFYLLFMKNSNFFNASKFWVRTKLDTFSGHAAEGGSISDRRRWFTILNITPKALNKSDDQGILIAGRVLNWLTNQQFPLLYKSGKDNTCPKRDVFIWALLRNKLSLARVLWENIITSDHISSALTASLMLKSMAREIQKFDNSKMSDVHRSFTSEAEWYENQAKQILEEFSRIDFRKAVALFLSASKDWGDITLCTLALSGKHVMFLDQECCRYALKITWNSPIERIEEEFSAILKSQHSNTANEEWSTTEGSDNNGNNNNNKDEENQNHDSTDSDHDAELYDTDDDDEELYDNGKLKCWVKVLYAIVCIFFPIVIVCWCVYSVIKLFKSIYTYNLHSPLFKFILYMISYVTFLVLFSYFLLFDLKPDKLSIYEYLVWGWILSLFLEEIRQIFDSYGLNLWFKVASYLTNSWNVYDLVGFVLFLVAIILRFTISEAQFYWVTMIYVVCLIMFILRLMQCLSVLEYFGPKIGILMRMFKDTIGYILMFGLFLIAYGIASQVLMYPNSSATSHVLFNIAYYPYFKIFGQFDLLQEQVFSCTYNDTLVSLKDGIPKCSWLANILSAIYAFVVCIMLINLLIATYSATYTSVEQNANALWLSYRVDFITEYLKKPTLPPPFNVLGLIFILMCRKCRRRDELKLEIEEECLKTLMDLENKSFSSMLKKQKDANAKDKKFSDDFDKMKADIQRILQHLQGIENHMVNKNPFVEK